MLGFDWPLWVNIIVLALCWITIGYVGFRLGELADVIAIRTGIGKGIMGAIFLAGCTSLPGLVVSVVAAYEGRAELAVSNAMGGIAGQTCMLVVADFYFRRTNLEHAADEMSNLISSTLVMALLGGTMVAAMLPGWSVGVPGTGSDSLAISPVTPCLILAYVGGLYLANKSGQFPQWEAVESRSAPKEEPAPDDGESVRRMWVRFAIYALITGTAGVLVAVSGAGIATQTGLGDTFVGALFTGLSTSTPEAVSTIAAARRGAADLAVGNILGSNSFDALFAAIADFFYLGSSIYHGMTNESMLLTSVTIVMTAVLMMGLLHRQERGPFRIGFESVLIGALYVGTLVVLALR